MSEIDHVLRQKPWEPEVRTDYVPEDAETAECSPCHMGPVSCSTNVQPIATTCECGFQRFMPKIGYFLRDLPQR